MKTCHCCGQNMPKRVIKSCDACGSEWADGIEGCPHCGDGNPYKGIACLTLSVMNISHSRIVEATIGGKHD